MMLKLRITYIALIVTLSFTVSAQQEPIYTQYMFNPLNYNPAYCGSKSVLSAALDYRNQWVGMEGAPKVVTFSIHSPLKNKNMGVGLEFTNDQIGPVNNVWIQASYAYRIRLSRISKGKLGFGLKAGIYRSSIDWTEINYKDQGDGIVGASRETFTVPVFDFGLYYSKTNRSFAGFTIKNLNSPNLGIENDISNTKDESRLYTEYILTYGKIIELNDRVVFRPSGLFRTTAVSTPMLDVNLSLLFDEVIWTGISIRTTGTISAVLQYEISQQFQIGYSYDYDFNKLTNYNSGSHEIFLGFSYNVFKSRMRSPRYYF